MIMSQSGDQSTAMSASMNPMHKIRPGSSITRESRQHSAAASFRPRSRASLIEIAREKKPWYIVMPDNLVFVYIWRPIRFLLLVWAAIVVPVVVSFDPFDINEYDAGGRLNMAEHSAFHTFVLVIDTLFMLDLLSNFLLAVMNEQSSEYVVSLRAIGARYLRGWFAIDFIAAFPFDLIVEAAMGNTGVTRMTRSLRLARVLRLMRIAKVAHLNEVLEGLEDKFRLSPAVSRIMRTVISIFLLINLIGAGWHGIFVFNKFMGGSVVGSQPVDDHYGWVDVFGYDSESIWTKYIASIYWAFITLSTVGFGEIHPTSSAEQIFAMFTMMIGVVVYALFTSSALSAMQESNLRQTKIMKRRRAVRDLCRTCPSIQNDLRDRMLRYLERKSGVHDRMVSAEHQKEVLSHLSPQLQQEALLQINEQKTHALLFFTEPHRGKFSGEFLSRFAQSAEYLCIEKDDIVCEEKTATTNLLVCVAGTLRRFKDGKFVGTATAKADGHPSVGANRNNVAWGLTECVNGIQHHESIVAGDRCHFYMLKAETVRELQSLFPQDHDKLRDWVKTEANVRIHTQDDGVVDAQIHSTPATRMIERHAQLAAREARGSFTRAAQSVQAATRFAQGANQGSPRHTQRHSMLPRVDLSVTPRADRARSRQLTGSMSGVDASGTSAKRDVQLNEAAARSPQPLTVANSARNTARFTLQQQEEV